MTGDEREQWVRDVAEAPHLLRGHFLIRWGVQIWAACVGVVALGEWAKRCDDEHTAQAWAEGPYVCPGCYAVAPERCAPGCIDAEIEEAARHESDGYEDAERDDNDEVLW